jgi:integrase
VLPNAQTARNVILDDDQVRAFVAAAYARDSALGLLIDVLAVTGTPPSQAVRLRVEDLREHPTQPKLMMPKSAKGGGRNRAEKRLQHYSVPITPALAAKLKAAAQGRAPDAPLLVRADDGRPWRDPDPSPDYRRSVREVVASIGLDPDVVTAYSLRHSSIVRGILRNVPIRLIAAIHNTSAVMVERVYSRFIGEFADEHARVALLEDSDALSDGENVVPIRRSS